MKTLLSLSRVGNLCVSWYPRDLCNFFSFKHLSLFCLLLFKSSSLSLESKWGRVAFISFSKVVFASLLKKEELDFISVAETITWGFFLQVEPGLFPSNFFFCRMLCMANNFCNRILFIPILFLIHSFTHFVINFSIILSIRNRSFSWSTNWFLFYEHQEIKSCILE